MIDMLRSLVVTEFLFLCAKAPESEKERDELKAKLSFPFEKLFDSEGYTNKAKNLLKKDFEKALSIYFEKYQTKDGFDFARLREALEEHERNFLRHLGKDKVQFLRLLIRLCELTKEKPKGLLHSVA